MRMAGVLFNLEGEAIFQIIDKTYTKYWALELIAVKQLLIRVPSLSDDH